MLIAVFFTNTIVVKYPIYNFVVIPNHKQNV